jgi:DNA-binding MarR family transcriptional regulator
MEQPVDGRKPVVRPVTAAATGSGNPEANLGPDVAAASATVLAESAADSTGVPGVPEAELTSALDPAELRAWRAFLTRHALLARRLEADLMATSGLPLAEYDVLVQLALADGRRLRMNELADRVLLSRAGITRLVDRLTVDGLVGRLKCASDARGYFAVLTAAGLARLNDATPGHMAAVRHFFLDAYTPSELAVLADLLERGLPSRARPLS